MYYIYQYILVRPKDYMFLKHCLIQPPAKTTLLHFQYLHLHHKLSVEFGIVSHHFVNILIDAHTKSQKFPEISQIHHFIRILIKKAIPTLFFEKSA